MSYLAIVLGITSMVLAREESQVLKGKGPDYHFPQLTPAAATGLVPWVSTGALSTGVPYPTTPSSSITTDTYGKPNDGKAAILSPIVPDGHDTTQPDNVIPKTQHTLHYAGNGNTSEYQ